MDERGEGVKVSQRDYCCRVLRESKRKSSKKVS